MKRSYSELDIKCKVGGHILGSFELSFSPITGYSPCNALTPGLSIDGTAARVIRFQYGVGRSRISQLILKILLFITIKTY